MTELSAQSSLPHDDAVREPFARLSARELEVLEMMSMGFTNAEIAEQLDVSVHAVKFHLAAIYRKLGVTNRTEATSMYMNRLGIGAARASELPAIPKTSGRDGDSGGVDLRLIGHVLWRFKPLVILGLVVGVGLALLTYTRQTEEFASYSTVFVTQQGFPWGRLTLDPTTGSVTNPRSSNPQFADPVRLSSLAILYSRLANSDPIRQLMLKDGPIDGRIEAAPLLASDNQDDALPLISIAGISGSRDDAQALSERTTSALVTYLADQQDENAIPLRDRVEIQVVNQAGAPKVLDGKSYTLPIVVFLAVLLAVVTICLVLANLFPEGRKRKAKDDGVAGDGDAGANDVAGSLPATGSGSAA